MDSFGWYGYFNNINFAIDKHGLAFHLFAFFFFHHCYMVFPVNNSPILGCTSKRNDLSMSKRCAFSRVCCTLSVDNRLMNQTTLGGNGKMGKEKLV